MKTDYTRLQEKKEKEIKPELILFNDEGGLREDLQDYPKTRREICIKN